MTIRDSLKAQLAVARDRGDMAAVARLEQLLRDANEASRLSLTGDGAPRSTSFERESAVDDPFIAAMTEAMTKPVENPEAPTNQLTFVVKP